ncbi:hypothetical protein ACOSP7_006811 [Xanthoceras sorbifolium]
MGTQNETNAEFRNEVHEILGRHESSIEEVHATLQTVLTELQSLRASQNHSQNQPEINPFASTESSQHAEQYFDFKEVVAEQQVQLALFHLEGIALQWHRWFAKLKGPVTWIEFTKALLLRFGQTDYEDPSEALTRLKQTTTVSAYEEEFEKLSHRVDELPEKFLVGNYKKKGISAFRSSIFGTQPKASNSNLVGILGPSPVSKPVVGNNGSPTPFKIITSQEARERREKGLYYYCDERFKPGHRCERPQLFMIEDTEELVEENLESLADQQRQEELPEISFHAITGTTHPQTIRLQGQMKGKEVIMLVDGGSTHNFVDQS